MQVLLCIASLVLLAQAAQQEVDLGDIGDLIEVIDYEISGEEMLNNFKLTNKALVMTGVSKKWPMYRALRDRDIFKETLRDVKVVSSMVHHETYGAENTTIGQFVTEGLYGAKFEIVLEDDSIRQLLTVPTMITSCKKIFDDFAATHEILMTGIKTKMRTDVSGSCFSKDMILAVMSGNVRLTYFGKKSKIFMHSGDLAYFPRGQCAHIKSNGTFIGIMAQWINQANADTDCQRPTTFSETKDLGMTDEELNLVKGNHDLPDKFLNTGYEMPLLGLGTARLLDQTYSSVLKALNLGYRLIDTAQIYSGEDDYESFTISSEDEIGRAIQVSEVKREDIFLVTKLDADFSSYEDAMERNMLSLERLQTNYIDLLLVHEFFIDKCKFGDKSGDCAKSKWEGWRSLVEMQSRGLARSIGVSNIFARDLKQLIKVAKGKVAVVQNWFDPLHQDREVREICQENNIVYMGYG